MGKKETYFVKDIYWEHKVNIIFNRKLLHSFCLRSGKIKMPTVNSIESVGELAGQLDQKDKTKQKTNKN